MMQVHNTLPLQIISITASEKHDFYLRRGQNAGASLVHNLHAPRCCSGRPATQEHQQARTLAGEHRVGWALAATETSGL